MIFEIHICKKIEADDFFEAVDAAKKIVKKDEEIIAVQPAWEEPEN